MTKLQHRSDCELTKDAPNFSMMARYDVSFMSFKSDLWFLLVEGQIRVEYLEKIGCVMILLNCTTYTDTPCYPRGWAILKAHMASSMAFWHHKNDYLSRIKWWTNTCRKWTTCLDNALISITSIVGCMTVDMCLMSMVKRNNGSMLKNTFYRMFENFYKLLDKYEN